MPPLSAYTPFESLLFFQSLAAHDTRPANFLPISDLLRNNPFVRQHVGFDATRLAPEALEDLYATLMRDGPDLELNGGHVDGANPRKRKIAPARPETFGDKGLNHATFVPGVVSHLYARYKELVTREIRNEEKRYQDIRDEIDRLQKEERDSIADSTPQSKTVPPKPVPQTSPDEAEAITAPTPMDLDTKLEEDKSVQQPLKDAPRNAVKPPPAVDAKRAPADSQQNIVPQQPMTPASQPNAGQAVGHIPKEQISKLSSQPQPPSQTSQHTQHPPSNLLPAQPVNGSLAAPQKPLAPRNHTGAKGTTVPPAQPTGPTPPVQVSKHPSAPGPVASSSHPPQPVGSASAPIQQSFPTAKTAGQAPQPAPSPASRPPPQPSFQQWSLNQPQTPRPSSHPIPRPATQTRPSPSQTPHIAPKAEPKTAPKAPQSIPIPSTPQPVHPSVQSETPGDVTSNFQTPASQSLPLSELRGRPRMSIDTCGSLTPWKRTPRLSIPASPRSPERPRPEDVSPISEKAPSLMGSREPTPEMTEPPRKRRRNDPKVAGRDRESSLGAADTESKSGLRGKPEKLNFSGSKRRDHSTASSRSRGRSVLSREDDTEAGAVSKIKHELPSTPAGVPETLEPDQRASGRKGAQVPEDRSGRGRSKRKRSEVFEQESPPNELGRPDLDQSTPYVLCARNFPRTGAPIMNEVTTHKHASIFTKPLTERDAPGYRDLIYRPQDLKTIKSSIHQGSKAVAAATEAANTPVADGESPAPNAGTPSKNAVLMLQKTEDVIPPKGIVNSAQLEKELIRMFANAVMFNPVPQRGFGPAFPMTSDSGSRASTQAPEGDEGGIIKDTVEMFDDVEKAITRWRAAERPADDLAIKSVLSLRRGSASDPNLDSADEVKG
ncbi:Bromodomain-containing protein [Aspergillus ambiguus]|uniref:uncharacterized protein n=1 Tax=Aspergillus ambiguus TaxID=176160 RepID=UPI003CCDE636